MPDEFEFSKAKTASGGMHEEGLGPAFCGMVKDAVRNSIPARAVKECKLTPFESDVMPFDEPDGTKRYFSIRGVAQSAPVLLFGSRIGHA